MQTPLYILQDQNRLELIEKRGHKRFSVRLKVYSQESNELLGYVVNLNTEGMMLMSMDRLPENKEIRIQFGTGNNEREQEKIILTVYSVWSCFTENVPRLFCSGLHFVNPSDEALEKIQNLINNFDSQLVD